MSPYQRCMRNARALGALLEARAGVNDSVTSSPNFKATQTQRCTTQTSWYVPYPHLAATNRSGCGPTTMSVRTPATALATSSCA
ncbi:uncharacterized protein METZ01_LOCUS450085, partial [marine metagenome]